MDARLRVLTTYKLLNNTRYFRLRLCAGGVVTGVLAGVIISCFRLALTGAASLRDNLQSLVFAGGYTPPAIALFCAALLIAAALLAWLAKAEPQAAGSGIPQVKGAVLGVFKLRWLRILLIKFAACALAIGSGLSLGRAGPSIQMGAMAGQGVSRLLARPRIEERYLISGGAAAGLAAVFNAPLAGVIFVLEEINHNFSGFLLFPVLSASVAATFTSRLILGRDTVFNFSGLPVLQYSDYWVILAAGIICGVLGALFNYGLLNAARLYKLLPNSSCLQNFLLLAVTAITGLYLPEALGGGDDLLTNTAFNSYPVTVLLMFLAAKLLLTLLAFGRGLSGGAFIPTLVAGGVAGAVMAGLFSQAGLLSSAYKTNIVILSMAAFFTASVRTPITATVLVMEMTGSFLHLLPLALASLTAFATTEVWRAKPLYGELFMRLLKNTKTLERNHAEQERSIMELTVDTGSTADGRLVREINWPRHSLLVDVKRGDEELIPEGNTRLHSGDTLYVLCYPTEIAELQKLTAK